MPAKTTVRSYEKQEFVFVNVPFNSTDEQAFEEWLKKHAPTETDAIDFLTGAGFRVTQSLGVLGDNPSCSITRVDTTKADYNRCISSNGNDIWDALFVTLYKWTVMLQGDILPEGGGRRSGGRR